MFNYSLLPLEVNNPPTPCFSLVLNYCCCFRWIKICRFSIIKIRAPTSVLVVLPLHKGRILGKSMNWTWDRSHGLLPSVVCLQILCRQRPLLSATISIYWCYRNTHTQVPIHFNSIPWSRGAEQEKSDDMAFAPHPFLTHSFLYSTVGWNHHQLEAGQKVRQRDWAECTQFSALENSLLFLISKDFLTSEQ